MENLSILPCRVKNDALPPHSVEAEAATLGCIGRQANSGHLDDATAMLDELYPGYFYDLRHRELFTAYRCLQIDGKPLDLVTVSQHLRDKKQLENAGGLAYLSSLIDNAIPVGFENYLAVIKDKFNRRELLAISAKAERLARDEAQNPAGLAAQFADAVKRLLETSIHNRDAELPPIIDVATFLEAKLETPMELVAGVLHQGSKLVFGGGSKTFKTWTLLDLAVSIAAGIPWLSFETCKGRVLFLNFEIQPAFFQQRIRAIADAKQIALAPGMIDLWNLRGQAAGYASIFPRITERIKNGGYALIVLDPVYKCYGGLEENSTGAVAGLMNAIEALAVDTGAAVAFGAHYSKGNQAAKESIDRISGSGVFARDPDTILNLTRHEEEDAFTVELTLRNFPPLPPFVVCWNYPTMRRDESLDPAKLKKIGGRKAEHDAGHLLTILPVAGLSNKNWAKAAEEQRGISKRTFYRLRSQLEKNNQVLLSKVNDLWMPVTKK